MTYVSRRVGFTDAIRSLTTTKWGSVDRWTRKTSANPITEIWLDDIRPIITNWIQPPQNSGGLRAEDNDDDDPQIVRLSDQMFRT